MKRKNKFFSVDRLDEEFAICESNDRKIYYFKKEFLPKEIKEGSVLKMKSSGEFLIDEKETQARKKLLKELQDEL
ncbi:MAG: DUF3006 domain-containing protein [Oscillospiraceae bacterium]|jgi:hypothetical protein|nr:DUF3006 domain-containing protein [Oscillospiraceae bacterium]